MRTSKDSGFEEIESLIYRLFAEKQFAIALLALIFVVNLISAQFLLLRLQPSLRQGIVAPDVHDRVDLVCEQGTLKDLEKKPVDLLGLESKSVVVHLDEEINECLMQVSGANVLELVVGVSVAQNE